MLRGAGRVFPGVGWGEEECEEEAHLPQAGQQPGDEEPAGDLGGPLDGEEDAVKVVVRVRPPLPRELNGFRPFQNAVLVPPGQTPQVLTLSENLAALGTNGVENGIVYNSYRFGFDRVYGPESTQEELYVHSARNAVHNVLQGYNASIIAYGQTGTGKTYTMEGERSGHGRGIIPRAIEDVFDHIQRDAGGQACKFLVRASYLQIYNEVISDLLKPESSNLVVREDKRRGVHVEGLSEWVVRSPAEVYALMERGAAVRATGATKLNEISSRSHAIFMLIVEKSTPSASLDGEPGGGADQLNGNMGSSRGPGSARQSVKVGKLNLVDLAGSERVHVTGATGKRLEESKKINQSLSALGNVIAALTDPKGRDGRPHVPYRDSKLTRILEDSLGGNCKTTFMAMVSPAVEAFAESLSTLKFANRAKCMRNLPKVNEDLDHRTLLRKYERELRRLRAELQQKSRDLVDKRLVLQIEEARRREQADKIAAIHALERQSQEIMRHKQAMAALQTRIASMQSQLLVGGQKIEDTPQFRTMLAKEQARIRQQYEDRLRELESERQSVQEDKAQAERYKALLLKQRDIMIGLTQRLNERDEQILALQAELEAYDSHQKKLEDALDQKTAELIALRRAAMEHNSKAAVRDAALDRAAEGLLRAGGGSGGGDDWQIAAGGAAPPAGPQPVPVQADSEFGGSETGSPLARSLYAGSGSEFGGGQAAAVAAVDGLQLQLEELRLQHGRELAEREGRWRAHAESLQSRLEAAQAAEQQQQQQQQHGQRGSAAAPGGAAYAAQCDALTKERDALHTILDTKVRVLVDDIQRSMGELPAEAQSHPKLGKQLEYLGKLVRATVQAMAVQQPAGAAY
ncbi:Kinesin-II 95 kDa subunit [Micractinium conductrix]|uniref:Kinesin-like protein n=1 Tax=Micractinium conductrix TaxID=554055 RepID=A0A2P6VK85_9CHLO|nr:Kinesin-II 95 kDa subunit [Micractinium conductrix]|eukprot:PSC74516.1 Kinesin-II 95 kDa subunit [Micractinium conductrix]